MPSAGKNLGGPNQYRLQQRAAAAISWEQSSTYVAPYPTLVSSG